jgi:hypothetical protein
MNEGAKPGASNSFQSKMSQSSFDIQTCTHLYNYILRKRKVAASKTERHLYICLWFYTVKGKGEAPAYRERSKKEKPVTKASVCQQKNVICNVAVSAVWDATCNVVDKPGYSQWQLAAHDHSTSLFEEI